MLGKEILNLQYSVIQWPVDPGNERARARFKCIKDTLYKLLKEDVFKEAISRNKVRILDVMAASGICGIALSKILVDEGVDIELTVSDLRESDLKYAFKWVEVAGLNERKFKLDIIVADAVKLPLYFSGRKFDIITVWGSSLPHIDAWRFPLLISGIRELQPSHGVVVIEQADLLPSILVNNLFKYILREGGAITIFESYDSIRGIQKRLLYKLPEMKYLCEVESRLWDIANIAASTWIFYKEIGIYEHSECLDRISRITKVLVAKNPRETVPNWRELALSLPIFIK